jgi:predicted permease
MPRRRSEEDFRREIEAHIELEAHVLERERGLSPEDARRVAVRRFGSLAAVQDSFRDARRGSWFGRYAQHLAHALRSLRRQPAFSLAVVGTLTTGIGLLASFFTFFNGFLIQPLPLPEARHLVHIDQQWIAGGPVEASDGGWFSWPDYLALRERAQANALESVAVHAPMTVVIGGVGEEIRGELVSCEWFSMLRVRFIAGRGFREDECSHPGAGAVVVLGHRTWSRHFDADPGVVGRTFLVNNRPLTVVGVSEERFAGVDVQRTELWIPATRRTALRHGADSMLVRPLATWLRMVGRLAPGSTSERAQAELQLVARALEDASPGRETRLYVRALRFGELDDADGRLLVIAMLALGVLVVVMGCANVMNLLLARAITRRREIGIRLAIGASRARLIEQLLTESAVLAILAGIASYGVAHAVPRIVYAVSPLANMQVDLEPDALVLAFALGVAVATTALFGLIPALQATALELSSAIRGNAGV